VLFIFGLGMFGSTFLLPLYLQNSLGYTAFQAGAVFLPVGILQGLMSPIAGILSDKVNPKIPAVIGIALLAVSLYLNGFLSLFSEHAQIMAALYIRGFAMGLVFTPLSMMALNGIPRQKLAQASGLFNVIRQVGGSFGVALIGTMLTRRIIYHSAMYGQALDPSSPAFKNASALLLQHTQVALGGTTADASMRVKALIGAHLGQQAFVQAINDDFLISAAITIVGVIPIFFVRRLKQKASAPHAAALD